MCNCGVTNLSDLKRDAKLTLVSSVSIVGGGSHDVILRTIDIVKNSHRSGGSFTISPYSEALCSSRTGLFL